MSTNNLMNKDDLSYYDGKMKQYLSNYAAKSELSAAAFSGNFNDLEHKPTFSINSDGDLICTVTT